MPSQIGKYSFSNCNSDYVANCRRNNSPISWEGILCTNLPHKMINKLFLVLQWAFISKQTALNKINSFHNLDEWENMRIILKREIQWQTALSWIFTLKILETRELLVKAYKKPHKLWKFDCPSRHLRKSLIWLYLPSTDAPLSLRNDEVQFLSITAYFHPDPVIYDVIQGYTMFARFNIRAFQRAPK